jgi:hypothetical protein
MISEVAVLNVRVGLEREFDAAFAQASLIIASVPGYISHQTAAVYRSIQSLCTVGQLDIYRGAHRRIPWLTRISTLEAAASSLL